MIFLFKSCWFRFRNFIRCGIPNIYYCKIAYAYHHVWEKRLNLFCLYPITANLRESHLLFSVVRENCTSRFPCFSLKNWLVVSFVSHSQGHWAIFDVSSLAVRMRVFGRYAAAAGIYMSHGGLCKKQHGWIGCRHSPAVSIRNQIRSPYISRVFQTIQQ